MANFDQLKQSVAALIRTNGAEEITGQIMQDVLLTIINSISGGYMFGGVAQHSGNVGNPDYNVFYLAGSGAYTGYGDAINIPNGCYGVFRYNGSWTQDVVDIGVHLTGTIREGETNGVTGDVINTALQQLFNNVMNILDTLTFTYNTPDAQKATKAMLDVIVTPTGGASHVLTTLTLASATVAAAGLMSAEDKQKVDRMLTDFRSLSLTDTTAAEDQATKIVQTLSATLGENPEAITTFTLLAATASKAGLLSAADKAKLDALWSSGYQFAGLAIPNTTPVSTTSKIFYIATEAGTYTSFGSLNVTQGINILSWDGSAWSAVQVIGIDDEPTAESENLVKSGGVNNSLNKLVQPVLGIDISFSAPAADSIPQKFYKGYIYTIYNDGDATVNFSTRDSKNGSTLDGVFSIKAGDFFTFTAQFDANYLRINNAASGRVVVKSALSQIGELERSVNTIEDTEETLSVTENSTYHFPFNLGETYVITPSGTVQLSTRNTESGEMIENIGSIPSGTTVAFKPTVEAKYLRVGFAFGGSVILTIAKRGDVVDRIYNLEEKVNVIEKTELSNFVFKQGFVNTINGGNSDSPNFIRTDFIVFYKSHKITCPDGFMIRGYANYNDSHIFTTYTFVNGQECEVAAGIYKFVVRKQENDTPIVPSEITRDNGLINFDLENNLPAVANFDFNTELLDVATELQGINMDETDSIGCYTFQDQIYEKIDSLVNQYPDKIQKIDLGEYTDEEYPLYANLAGEASGEYQATPTYRTYMYKLSLPTSVANVGRTSTKRSIFIVAGLHGWENASQLNTYIIASKICESACNDWYALMSVYDIYIVPCANGYGAYHDLRVNANSVDLNRNFPYYNWEVKGEGTINYSGPSAASEFETKIICKAVELIKPDVFIDHHSYGPTTWNFYVNPSSDIERDLTYINLYAWNYRACTEYPQYYGSNYDIHPSGFWPGDNQCSNVWARNLGINMGACVEVCLGIGYVNGETIPLEQARQTYYKEPIVRLNELMLRLALLRYVNYQIKQDKKTEELDARLLV